MKRVLIVLIACGLFITLACKKSKDAPPLTVANVAGGYKFIAEVTTSPDSVVTDAYAQYQPCSKDDIWNFNADNSLVVTDAGVTCDPSDGWSSTWSLDGQNITVAGVNGTVTKWDGSTLEVKLLLDDGTKDKMTFKK